MLCSPFLFSKNCTTPGAVILQKFVKFSFRKLLPISQSFSIIFVYQRRGASLPRLHTAPRTFTPTYQEKIMQSIGDAPAYYKRAKRLHRAAYHRSTRLTPARKARFVAESITLKQDE